MQKKAFNSGYERIEIDYYEDDQSFINDNSSEKVINDYNSIKKMEEMVQFLDENLAYTGKPEGFPRFVVTMEKPNGKTDYISVDKEGIISANFLDAGNHTILLQNDIYSFLEELYCNY